MKRPKFKMLSHVSLTADGKVSLRAISRGGQPTAGDFKVRGRVSRPEGYTYSLENIKDPDHFALWVPESWLVKAKGE